MRLAGASIEMFRRMLRRPLAPGLSVREGLILRLVDDEGRVGLGEASPAPWVGGEPLAAARVALARVVAAVRAGAADESLDGLAAGLPPSAASALEAARLDLVARRRGESLAAVLGGAAAPVALSALVTGQAPRDLARAGRELSRAGFRCLKLKVGGRPAGAELDRVAALHEGAGPSVAIRLDANRTWTMEEAGGILRGAAAFGVELVEEPLREENAVDLERLRGETGIAVALDESVREEADLRRALDARSLDVLVLKAARVGGPRRALALAHLAHAGGVRSVVTDSLETSVGGRLALHLAAALPGPPAAVGLGGAACFASDPGAPAGWGRAVSIFAAGPGIEVAPTERTREVA